ncbi:hypothetical protein DV495_002933 [Geotrichum candidum]|uniref:Uncharacterized protein n=1 Tax=Geotrichum candidum TaxID=1173061 RepID=A0A0J9XAB9_GEOCN|nr:hypothetical protein DV454_004707 [Geotrichum candidum]KAI9213380.1 hypothetical protein DS838_001719 [Geotrichum bryndzae]KAF5119327.1 hypothetical protein DV452_001746 [Geotrichum candidum]KAF5128789.1 hypothetical protein DV495_002933 [Geotrichum candidum]KAF7498126.1 hypothetical protein DV113_003839 [Geotrichum candidum]
MASTQNLPGQPPWRNSSLPFMVIVDTTTSAGPALPPAPRSQHEPTTNSINNNNNSSSSHDTPVPPPPQPPEEEWETIYPDVRYIFSDDQFFPTVEVLNSQTTTTASAADDNDPDAAAAAAAGTIPSGTVVVDFDQTGQKIVDINSLAVDWQVAGVSLGAAAATAAVTKSPAARPSTEPDTGSPRRTTATATQQLPPPPWAEEAMQSDSVAHVLRIRGVRSARPLPPYYYSSSAATPTAGAASVGRAAVASPAALVAAFCRTNAQIRQILDLTMTADATTPASTAPDSRPASPPTPQTD